MRDTNTHAQTLLGFLLGDTDNTQAPIFAEARAAAAELADATSTPSRETITSGEVHLGFHNAGALEFAREQDSQVRQRIERATEGERTEIANQARNQLGRAMEVLRAVGDEDEFRRSETFAVVAEVEVTP